MIRGAMLEQGIKLDQLDVMYTRYQDGVPFYVKNGFVEAGGTRLKRDAGEWTKGGGRVLYEGPKMPVCALAASTSLDLPTRAGLQRVMVDLKDNAAGRNVLARLKMSGFERPTPESFSRMAQWLGFARPGTDATL
jgi:hypothetical protein